MGVESNTIDPGQDSLRTELVKVGSTSLTGLPLTLNSTTQVTHGLGFVPIALAYLDTGTIASMLPMQLAMGIIPNTKLTIDNYARVRVSRNNITTISDSATALAYEDLPVKYYLLRYRGN